MPAVKSNSRTQSHEVDIEVVNVNSRSFRGNSLSSQNVCSGSRGTRHSLLTTTAPESYGLVPGDSGEPLAESGSEHVGVSCSSDPEVLRM